MQKKVVEPKDATGWLEKNVYGHITPDQLNDDRIEELNSMDYMQNSSIFYNPESILEMQIFSCSLILNIHHLLIAQKKYVPANSDLDQSSKSANDMPNLNYVIIFLVLHIFSYLIHYFRVYDIGKNGIADMNGVYSAKTEAFISNIETFIICIVIGITVKHLNDMSLDAFHQEGIRSYFIIFDGLVTFLFKSYVYMGLVIKLDSEITKNLYTLY